MTSRHINICGVTKTYPGAAGQGDIHALAGVDLKVDDGERVGIVGPNGAGKSTLLQIIAGVTPPTAGALNVSGRVSAILSVGVGLREEATGRENLFLDGVIQGRSHAQTAAALDRMIDFAGLEEFIDQPVRTYSSGMKARLAFASLITIEPEILIIDEALVVGDIFFGRKATSAIKALTEKGAIVIVVSHSLQSINEICSRCVWIEAGRVRMDGGAKEVTEAYRAELHKREEVEINRKFGDSGAPWAKHAAILEIETATLVSQADGGVRTLLEAGEAVALSLQIKGKSAGQALNLRIWAERNDGMVLFDEQLAVAETRAGPAGREVLVDLGCLSWRPFLYQIHAEILTPKGMVAHNAATVKVWSDHVIQGGAPLLRDPIGVTVRRS